MAARLHCKQKAATKAVPAGKHDPPEIRKSRKKALAAIIKSNKVKYIPVRAAKSKAKSKSNRKADQPTSSVDQVGLEQGFRFLDLIPEIRNLIYELALRSKDTIIVNRELKSPPLLVTCTQIRNEASSIWYRDNQFTAEVYDCDAAALNNWSQHCCTVGQRDYFDVTIFLEGYLYWNNLLDWCRAIWKDDRARILVHEDDLDEEYRIVSEAHHIAMQHKGKSWSKCVRALEDMKIDEEALGNPSWFEDDSDDE